MIDYMEIGPTPSDESCAQVGSANYAQEALEETSRYMAGLLHYFGPPPAGAAIVRQSCPHDLGSYYEVCVRFNDDNPPGAQYAYMIEGHAPPTWNQLENSTHQSPQPGQPIPFPALA